MLIVKPGLSATIVMAAAADGLTEAITGVLRMRTEGRRCMLSARSSVLWVAGHGVRCKSCRGKSERRIDQGTGGGMGTGNVDHARTGMRLRKEHMLE